MIIRALQAQALDNRSEDPLQIPGQPQLPDRVKVMSAISRVGAGGQILFSQNEVLLIGLDQEALVQLPCVERDMAGRLAPVVCWLEADERTGDELQIAEAVEAFIISIERSISAQTRASLQEALAHFSKKLQVPLLLLPRWVQQLPAPLKTVLVALLRMLRNLKM